MSLLFSLVYWTALISLLNSSGIKIGQWNFVAISAVCLIEIVAQYIFGYMKGRNETNN